VRTSVVSPKKGGALQLMGIAHGKRVPIVPMRERLDFQGFVARDAYERGSRIHEKQLSEPKSWIDGHS
jgi:hypothetical protein